MSDERWKAHEAVFDDGEFDAWLQQFQGRVWNLRDAAPPGHFMVDGSPEELADDLDRFRDLERNHETAYDETFDRFQREPWAEAFARLGVLIKVGEWLSIEHLWRENESEKLNGSQDVRALVVHGFAARAVRISREAHVLLRAGYPLGAEARNRTLHELGVFSRKLVEDTDRAISARYVASEIVRAAHDQKEAATRIRRVPDPLTPEQYRALQHQAAELRRQHPGWDLKSPTGWAGYEHFRDLEKDLGMDSARPIFSAASAEVHGGPLGSVRNRRVVNGKLFHQTRQSYQGVGIVGEWTVRYLCTTLDNQLACGIGPDQIPAGGGFRFLLRQYSDTVIAAFNGPAIPIDPNWP